MPTDREFSSILAGVEYLRITDPKIPCIIDSTFTGSVSIGAVGRKLPHLLMDLAHATDTEWQAVGYMGRELDDELGYNLHDQVFVDLFTLKEDGTFAEVHMTLRGATSMWKVVPIVKSWFSMTRKSERTFIAQATHTRIDNFHFLLTKEILENLNVYIPDRLNKNRWLFRYRAKPLYNLWGRLKRLLVGADTQPIPKGSNVETVGVYWTKTITDGLSSKSESTRRKYAKNMKQATDWWRIPLAF